ncbi:MAG: hypothetical protein KC736_01250 [Candidatus Moranbacteria bacterium]|nr:hypothetical protein [Candidatus Moranbacteria bacterium]
MIYLFSFWVGFAWLAYLLSVTGVFLSWIFGAYLFFGICALLLFLFVRKGWRLLFLDRELLLFCVLAFSFVIVLSLFVTPTVFTGRDEGSLSTAAILLSQNGSLVSNGPVVESFFSFYGSGKALNFPGFFYNDSGGLVPQFPIPYIAWLGVFFSLFGIFGFTLANAVFFFLFLVSFFLLGRALLPCRISAWLGVLFVVSSFSFSWFFGFTLSENFALFLVWVSILSLILFARNGYRSYYWLFLFSSGLLVFARIEGIALFVFGLGVLFFISKKASFFLRNPFVYLILPLLILVFLFAFTFETAIPFYKTIIKAFLGIGVSYSTFENSTPTEHFLIPFLDRLVIFFNYGLLFFFITGFFGVWLAFLQRKKSFLLLIPFIVLLPFLIYLIDPQISSDHPWVLRRYVFALLPLFIFYATYFVCNLFSRVRIFSIALSIVLVLSALPSTVYFFTFSEHATLLDQTELLSQRFSSSDVILIDKYVSGDSFSMISGPMHSFFDRQAVYIFNPEDLLRVPFDRFSSVYLIVPRNRQDVYVSNDSSWHVVDSFDVTTNIIDDADQSSAQFFFLPRFKMVKTENVILKREF